MRFFFLLAASVFPFACLGAACGGNVVVTTSTTGSSSSGTGGGGGSGPDCGGLGCPVCDVSSDLNAELCASSQPCSAAADCAALPAGPCTMNLGTGTLDFYPAGCVAGQCAYHPVGGSCEDGFPCDQCAAQAKATSCAFQPSATACASCCVTRYAGSDYAPIYGACACGAGGPCATACSASALCGGAGPESDGCLACLQAALTDGGACVASAAFQAACIHETGSVFCKKTAQCLVGCPAP